MGNVVHLTSAHPRYDVRIYVKMCRSLAKVHEVSLVVADGLGDEINNSMSIFDVGAKTGGRLSRMTSTVKKVYKKAVELDAELYHLHDPELLPIAVKLKRRGKLVIFDAHEDLPKQLLGKPYLHPMARIVLSKIVSKYEKWVCPKLDAVIGATPVISDKFGRFCKRSENINNFPLLNELSCATAKQVKAGEVAYVGGISEIRGIKPLVKSLGKVNGVRLNLVGKFGSKQLKEEVKSFHEFNAVNELGFRSREEVAEILARSRAGIVTFLASPNHIDAQPNKMFEYMSAGLPIVTSNFPLWKEIVEGNDCGICVDPENIEELARAIQFLNDNPAESQRLGENGRRAVVEKYNWEQEEQKLAALYKELFT
ncbi:MAG: glycosyltransferase family 4 protein [Oleiphilaceae bacterium]|nr:glycosyltransferase family 4 protein [Oleiphilaceae bacterium]